MEGVSRSLLIQSENLLGEFMSKQLNDALKEIERQLEEIKKKEKEQEKKQ